MHLLGGGYRAFRAPSLLPVWYIRQDAGVCRALADILTPVWLEHRERLDSRPFKFQGPAGHHKSGRLRSGPTGCG